MAIKQVELENGCFGAAKDREPLFVLRSTDARAPGIVREWARLYLANRVRNYPHPGDGAEPAAVEAWEAEHQRRLSKHAEALMLADKMECYRQALEQAQAQGATEEEAHNVAADAAGMLPG